MLYLLGLDSLTGGRERGRKTNEVMDTCVGLGGQHVIQCDFEERYPYFHPIHVELV